MDTGKTQTATRCHVHVDARPSDLMLRLHVSPVHSNMMLTSLLRVSPYKPTSLGP